jgi:predicted N-acetyltransferase YhbS
VIVVRPVIGEEDIDTYIDVRNHVHPEMPMPREVVIDDRKRPDHLDLIAELAGEPVGVASVSKFAGAPDGGFAYLTIRVRSEYRRQGVGSALDRRASEHAGGLGKSRFYAVVRDIDTDSLGYYGARGFDEIGRMQDVELELVSSSVEPEVPTGIEIVPAIAEHDRGVYEVALEAVADIPSPETIVPGDFEDWRQFQFGPLVERELSFVALDQGAVVGYAILGRFTEDTYQHWMTGVARQARNRGIALALKRAQIAAAREAGVKSLRTQNDLGNASMRRVNEKLGYRLRFEWVHLAGPLLA